MKTKILSLIAGAIMLGAGSASAVTYIDQITADTDVDPAIPVPASGSFSLFASDFDPGIDTLTSAETLFVFADFDDAPGELDAYSIFINGNLYESVTDFDLLSFTTFSLTPADVAVLNATGTISYSIVTDSGVFFPALAQLTAQGVEGTTPVPDGGATVALLGMGLCGLAGLKSRFARK